MNVETLDMCTRSILNGRIENCKNHTIKTRNYWIKTSEFSMYIYIANPIMIKIACGNAFKIISLQKSKEIDFEDQCEITKITNDMILDQSLDTYEEINSRNWVVNVTIFDHILKNWTYNITNINKNEILAMEMVENLNKMEEQVKKNNEPNVVKKALRIIAYPFNMLFNGFLNSVFSGGIQLILLSICLYVAFRLICYRQSNNQNNQK